MHLITTREAVIGLLLLTLTISFYTWDYPERALHYIDQTSERTLEAFAVARGINAVISVIQNAEIGFTFGVSATLSPGEILDPVNDLIERFSLVMLVAATVFWTLRLVGGLLFGEGLLWSMIALYALGYGLRRAGGAWLTGLGDALHKGLVVFLALLLYTIITPLLVQLIHDTQLVQKEYQASSSQLTQARDRLAEMNLEMESVVEGSPPASSSCDGVTECMEAFADTIGRLSEEMIGYSTISRKFDSYIEEATRIADRVSHQVVIQIAVFVLETLLIPLAMLWLMTRLVAHHLRFGSKP